MDKSEVKRLTYVMPQGKALGQLNVFLARCYQASREGRVKRSCGTTECKSSVDCLGCSLCSLLPPHVLKFVTSALSLRGQALSAYYL
jgi:hypothetical protein